MSMNKGHDKGVNISQLTLFGGEEESVSDTTTHLDGEYAGVSNWVPVVACDTDW